jgi:hypothetical protein
MMSGAVIKFPIKRLNERRRRAKAKQERRFLADTVGCRLRTARCSGST